MTEELLINVNTAESRVALLEDGVLTEIFIERQHKLGIVGNIYLGTVVRVLPGMQAAFVDIGQARTAFLHIDDMPTGKAGQPKNNSANTEPTVSATTQQLTHPSAKPLSIEQRLYEGQRVMVQAIKDPLGTKGARLTTDISLPSRYLVYLPFGASVGISQRIDGDERIRLKTTLSDLLHQVGLSGGLIARTAAENVASAKLEQDIYYLLQLWRTVQARYQHAAAQTKKRNALIYQDLSLPLRALRDLIGDNTKRLTVDNAQVFADMRQFAKEFMPAIYPAIQHYDGKQPLFDMYRIEADLKNALDRRVDLPSGGYLIIDQTEAMTTIDVNTGSFVGGHSLEDTVYKTNLEAAHAIARQLRLRNLGGIIILDFIDMVEQAHREEVLASLQNQLAQDHAKTNISNVSALGLIEMTRKRTRESLQQQLCEPCPTCEGKGVIKSRETVCLEIFRELMRCAKTYETCKKFTVVANPEVIELLKTTEADTLAEMAYLLGKPIHLSSDSRFNQEAYDILLN